MVIVNAAPLSRAFVALISHAGGKIARTRHLPALGEIVDGMEDRIGRVDIDDGTIRKHAFHRGVEDLPLILAPEIVAHEEAAAEQILAQFRGLRVGKIPVTYLNGIEP